MNPLIGASLIGGGVSAIGNLFSGQSNAKAAERNYRHRYQWEVEDLKRAGLNPALAYGHNAPIPQTQPLEPLGDSIVRGAQTAASARQSTIQGELLKSQKNLLDAQAYDLIESVKIKNALMFSQAQQAGALSGLTMMQQDIAQQTLRGLQADNAWKERTLEQRVAMWHKALAAKDIEISRAQLELALRQLDQPGKAAEAKFFNTVGAGGTNNAVQLLRMLGGFLK